MDSPAAPPAEPTEYDPKTIRIFVQTVSRAFYESSAIILLDTLLRKPAFRDDDLASHTALTVKELGKIAGPLFGDRLIKTFTRNEHKDGPIMPHARPVSKTYYWIDHKEFCDVVRWRMDTLYKSLDKKLRTEQENKGYICSNPTCRRTYLPVDIPINFSPEGNLLCDSCGWELEDNNEAEDVKGSEDKMAVFNVQTAWIQEGLRKTSEMIFPVFDIHEWLAANTRGGEAETVSATSVQVELQLDGDDAKKASERAKVAAAQRTQNVIPSWHLYSTVSGQQTALGISHAAQLESARAGYSNTADDDEVQVDEKATEALEDYYTNLRTSSSAVKPEPVDENEDAFNPNGKRERSSSPILPSGTNPFLRAQSTYDSPASGSGSEPKRARLSASPEASEQPVGSGNGVKVMVDGVAMAFEDVTEDDQERMSPDEYTAYFEVWSELNS